IVAFYDPTISEADFEGRRLDQILAFNDNELEYHHDFIQYLFPLPERSPVNPHAPTITKDVRDAFLSRPDLRQQLTRSLQRMLEFYGFTTSPQSQHTDTISIVRGANFQGASKATWRTRMDHNHLRISRILRSLRVLGLDAEAKAFYDALLENDRDGSVSQRSKLYWQRAVERGLHLAPQD
ncbi:opioid growth factor receptor conserved domain-containing protein, partial [Neohortaea acidophila]